jgi:acetyl esterase
MAIAPPTLPPSALSGVVTTGLDVSEETRAFNEQLIEMMSGDPPFYEEVGGPADIERIRREGFAGIPRKKQRSRGSDRTVTALGRDVRVRVIRPKQIDGVYLFLHGGGHVFGSPAAQDEALWKLAKATNLAIVGVDYRLAPEHPYPAAPEDCEAAAVWLVEHSHAEFGNQRLAIGGDSAGAHLAVLTLLCLRDAHRLTGAFRAVYLNGGSYDMSLTPSARAFGDARMLVNTPMLVWFRSRFLPGRSPEELRDPAISPLYADLRDMPAARFVVGTRDHSLDDALFMAERWRAAGSPAELEVVADAPHGFTLFPLTVAKRELDCQQEFLRAAIAA